MDLLKAKFRAFKVNELRFVVVVYQVTYVESRHWLLKKKITFGDRLRSKHCREFILDTMQTRLLRSNFSVVVFISALTNIQTNDFLTWISDIDKNLANI